MKLVRESSLSPSTRSIHRSKLERSLQQPTMNMNRTNKGNTMIIHWPHSSLHYTPQITSNSIVQVTTEHKLYSNYIGRGEGDSSKITSSHSITLRSQLQSLDILSTSRGRARYSLMLPSPRASCGPAGAAEAAGTHGGSDQARSTAA